MERERERKGEKAAGRSRSLSAFLVPVPTFLRHYVFLLSAAPSAEQRSSVALCGGNTGVCSCLLALLFAPRLFVS